MAFVPKTRQCAPSPRRFCSPVARERSRGGPDRSRHERLWKCLPVLASQVSRRSSFLDCGCPPSPRRALALSPMRSLFWTDGPKKHLIARIFLALAQQSRTGRLDSSRSAIGPRGCRAQEESDESPKPGAWAPLPGVVPRFLSAKLGQFSPAGPV